MGRSHAWNVFKDALFPLKCLMCGRYYLRPSDSEDPAQKGPVAETSMASQTAASLFQRVFSPHICPDCMPLFTPIESPLCTWCGMMFSSREGGDHVCGACLEAKHYFSMARAVGIYHQVLMKVVHALKYEKKVNLAAPLSLLLLHAFLHFWHDRPVDVVVPVPLFHRRFRSRGFNQVYLAIKYWTRQTYRNVLPRSLEIDRQVLVRQRSTPPQTGLGRRDRMRNVKDAFARHAHAAIEGKRMLLVDDVYTTGATVNECARVLLHGGAANVDVLTLARAI